MNASTPRRHLAPALWAMPLAAALALGGCSQTATSTTSGSASISTAGSTAIQAVQAGTGSAAANATARVTLTRDDIKINETLTDEASDSHAICADATSADYANVEVVKTGDSDGDEADFYGTNAAVMATNGGTLNLSDMIVTTNGKHANAVFSYGEGSTVNIQNSLIETTSDGSGGIMVTGGGVLNATGLTVHTTGNSSAAIRSDRGGGTQNVQGGTYTTDGTGSPVIYSTADVNVTDASLTSTASQGVVVEGQNSVSLTDCDLVASNTTKNSDKSDWYQAVMIYQSMSGDADEGVASFSMNGGTLTNKNGDIFFVNNTVTTIDLTGATITNEDASGLFLRAAAAGWGSEGSNGGHVTLNAAGQVINGAMAVDSVSSLNLYLKGSSSFEGTINESGDEGEVYVEIEKGSTWTLTGDAHITSLTCEAGSINLNGHTLYVGGQAYTEGSASTGTAIEVEVSSTGGGQGGPGGAAPDGQGGPGGSGGSGQGGPDSSSH